MDLFLYRSSSLIWLWCRFEFAGCQTLLLVICFKVTGGFMPRFEIEEPNRFARRANVPQLIFSPNQSHLPRRPASIKRGVSRSSRTLERDAMDALARKTRRAEAYGEVVWF
jgi:hypothetical protein